MTCRAAHKLAALLAVQMAAACDDVPFASVEVLLRQPVNVGDRSRDPDCTGREGVCLQLSRSLDGGAAEGVSFANGFRGPTAPLPLGRAQRLLELEVFTGDPSAPSVLGRADAALVPPIDEQGHDVAFVRSALFAARDVVEALDTVTPEAQAAGATCSDAAGSAWFFGAAPFGFAVDTLAAKRIEQVPVEAGDSVACAAQTELPDGVDDLRAARDPVMGRYYQFVGDCTVGGGVLRSGSAGIDATATIDAGNGCGALVAVRGDALWVVQQDVVTLHDRATLEQSNRGATFDPLLDPMPAPRTDAIVLADGSLLVAEPTGGTTRYTPTGTDEVDDGAGPSIDVARFALHAGAAWAITNDRQLINLDDAGVAARELTLPALTGIIDAALLRDGSVVMLGPEGVAVEGAASVVPLMPGHGRFALTVTVGSALLLWGGAAGLDVLVPGRPELLAVR